MINRYLLIKILDTGIVKLLSAFSGVVATLFITRYFAPTEAGNILFAIAVFTSVGVLIRLGMDNIVLKYSSIDNFSSQSFFIFCKSVRWIAIPSGLVLFSSLTIYLFFNHLSEKLNCILIILLGIPFYGFTYLYSFVLQGKADIRWSIFMQNFGINLIFSIYAITISSFNSISVTFAASLIFLSTLTVFFFATLLFIRDYSWSQFFTELSSTSLERNVVSDLAERRNYLFSASFMSVLIQWAGIVIGGLLLVEDEIAYLSVAQRAALLISFALMVVNIVVSPKYSKMWAVGNTINIEKLAKSSSFLLIVTVTPFLILLFVFSSEAMAVFGSGYSQAGQYFVILLVGQFVNVATGSVGYLLNMTGHEKEVRNTTMISGVYALFSTLLFTISFGAVGTAVSISSSVVLQNLILSYFVYKRLNFLPFNIFSLLKKSNR